MATNSFVSTNFNGNLDEFLYQVMQDGADFMGDAGGNGIDPTPAAAFMKTGTRDKTQLDRVKYTEDPFENYVTTAPTFASGSSKEKRDVEPKKMTLSGTFQPDEWLADWDPYAPTGTLTALLMNPQYQAKIMELALNAAWTQLAKLFWQGDVGAGGGSPLRFFDGIITRLIADSDTDVTFITPAGVITQANVVDRLVDMYNATPNKFLKDPNYKIHTSFEDFKLLQLFNNDSKKTAVGVLDEQVRSLFLNKRIVPYLGLPKDHLVGARNTGAVDSNFVFDTYFSMTDEFTGMQIDKVENLGKVWGYRVDFMADSQYRSGEDVTLYKPV